MLITKNNNDNKYTVMVGIFNGNNSSENAVPQYCAVVFDEDMLNWIIQKLQTFSKQRKLNDHENKDEEEPKRDSIIVNNYNVLTSLEDEIQNELKKLKANKSSPQNSLERLEREYEELNNLRLNVAVTAAKLENILSSLKQIAELVNQKMIILKPSIVQYGAGNIKHC